jgi:tetratricopeptide (TPR) repeat protein
MSTYLKKYYLDDRKLAQRALLEFHRALKSGRMIAFTGAMTTEGFGYPDWEGLISEFRKKAKNLIECPADEDCATCARLDAGKKLAALDEVFKLRDPRVGLSLIGEIADLFDKEHRGLCSHKTGGTHYRGRLDQDISRLDRIELAVARIAREPDTSKAIGDINIPQSLWKDIGIQRFATLNYDLELERLLMLTSAEQEKITQDKSVFELLEELRDRDNGTLNWSENSSRIRRILPNGRTVESDIVSRDRSDRLVDFAMGSDDAEQHILHLHGRCDEQKTIVFSYRDYDRLYRRNDLHRQPFEYGHRIMTGGNPILFLGLGMGEPEINRTMEDFISNTPYHRTAPTFLFWNTRDWNKDSVPPKAEIRTAEQRAAFRIDKLHRLGVFTIFDTDVLDAKQLRDLKDATAEPTSRLQNVQLLTKSAAATAAIIGEREHFVGEQWRNMLGKISKVAKPGNVAKLWGVKNGGKADDHIAQDRTKLIEKLKKEPSPIFSIASAGWGKGQLGSTIAAELAETKPAPYVLHANAGFCFDTDSFLDTIVRFLEIVGGCKDEIHSGKPWNFSASHISRDHFFAQINLCGSDANLETDAYCIINGIDRFLDVHGLPLSAEFDRFIEQLFEDADPKAGTETEGKAKAKNGKRIRWLFLGSDRTRLYLQRKESDGSKCKVNVPKPVEMTADAKQKNTEDSDALASSYLDAIRKAMENFSPAPADASAIYSANRQAMERSGEARRLSIERLRRAFFDAYLETGALSACDLTLPQAELAMEILRALAFIGLPVEENVLVHVPRIFRMLDSNKDGKLTANERKIISPVLKKLCKLNLVLNIEGFEDSSNTSETAPPRYGLHRAVMAELRFRLGLPLSEAKLSTAFNMSLYVAQPVDGYIPEPEIHDELGELIDHLIGAYRDDIGQSVDIVPPWAKRLISRHATSENPPYGFDLPSNKDYVIQLFHRRCKADYVACLRAALAVIRGYYSTTGLLTLDRNDRLMGDDRDGILLEHAERLDDLLDGYGKTAMMRDKLRRAKPKKFVGTYGNAEPFYSDELVWLQNERGVVRLAMGDLHEANRSFQTALSINMRHVEYGDRSHNWRRVKLNQLTIEIERGELFAAERMIREILEASGWPIEKRTASLADAEKIFDECRSNKRQSFSADKDVAQNKHYFLQEDRLAIAIALGYRGMCANLRGEMLDAIEDLDLATQLLRKLDEQRAFAYFSRLFAWALREIGNYEDSDRHMGLAIDAAQSTRQMDLVYRTEIMRSQWQWEKPGATDADRRTAARSFNNALDYGIAADMQRVRTEAASSLAKLKLSTGDHEVALQYTAEAMTIATRYNLKLRMMSVRVRLGEIMIRRGDVKTGKALIMGAIKSASRSGFQRVVDSGQLTLDKLGDNFN